jgi:hypothetical protein
MLSTATSNASEGFSSLYQSIPRIQIVLPKIWLASKKLKSKNAVEAMNCIGGTALILLLEN